ncbi:hypothetical protein OROMI_022134 [Orobanche minor]
MHPHHQFFASLKHLEKRLKLESHTSPHSAVPQPPPPPLPTELTDTTQESDSLGTPIYLNSIPTNTNPSPSNVQESEAPNEFLSRSSDLPHEDQSEINGTVNHAERSSLDCDIELLMQLLGLSEADEVEGLEDVGRDDGFYGKIVGVKGPKSVKEAERLEGWIKYFLEGEKKELFALAHLLLGKAGLLHSDDGFGGFVFPSTIDEFLRHDPPANY